MNLENAREQGIIGATILHPWNESVATTEGIVGARDWRELRIKLDPVLKQPRPA